MGPRRGNGAHVRARDEAERGKGAPASEEPGFGAEPHLKDEAERGEGTPRARSRGMGRSPI